MCEPALPDFGNADRLGSAGVFNLFFAFFFGVCCLAGVFVGRDRGREDREGRLRDREEVGQIIRIDPGNIRLFIDASRSWKSFEEILRRGGSPIEFFVEIMSRALITALTTPGEVIPVISKSSYVSALRSRMVIAIEVLRNDVEAALNSCVALAEKYARKELTVEEEKEELPKCIGLINNLPLVGLFQFYSRSSQAHQWSLKKKDRTSLSIL